MASITTTTTTNNKRGSNNSASDVNNNVNTTTTPTTMTTTTTTTMNNNNTNNNTNNKKKQGGYGKIPTHTKSKFQQLLHFREVYAAFSLLYLNPLESNLSSVVTTSSTTSTTAAGTASSSNDNNATTSTFDSENLKFCNEILIQVSRSFAAVIHQLPSILLVDVMIFYLVLRALDTIEDDMTYFQTIVAAEKEEEEAADANVGMTTDSTAAADNSTKEEQEEEQMKYNYKEEGNKLKIQALLSFHQTALLNPHWKLMGCGDGDECCLLEHFFS